MKEHFTTTLQSMNIGMQVTIVPIPINVETAFGTKGKLDIKGTVDGLPIQRTLLPAGDGTHYFIIKNAFRRQLGKEEGDTVTVEIEPDETYKDVEIPDILRYELEENDVAKAEYNLTSPSNQRWMRDYLTDVKSLDAKANRVLKVLEILERNSKRRIEKSRNKNNEET
jgi:Domain of unknown function (DUF1905)/Bacteriocin-protection, YdeI or OmpD-Associated